MKDIEATKDRRTFSWEYDHSILGLLTALPFVVMGFSHLLYLIIGAAFLAIAYSKKRKTYYWLEIAEGKLRYSKTRENISKYEYDETFADRFKGKEIELKDIEKVKFSMFRSFIDVRLKSSQSFSVDLISTPSVLKREIYGELIKYVVEL